MEGLWPLAVTRGMIMDMLQIARSEVNHCVLPRLFVSARRTIKISTHLT